MNINDFIFIKNDIFNIKDFATITKHLVRPYIYISKKLYNQILKKAKKLNCDFIYYNNNKYTFGDADGKKALMLFID